jgi:uncharacterized protein (TIGR00730 family)
MQKKNELIADIIRVVKFSKELLYGHITFRNINRTITVFGSARIQDDNKYYEIGVDLGKELAKNNYAVMTGGGPGLMEAANKGAKLAGGKSYGCSIKIPNEQKSNTFLDKVMEFKYFFARKVILTRFSSGFVALPGGYGTLDELFEMATLVKTDRMKSFPIVLIGCDFWQPMLTYLKQKLVTHGTISDSELNCFYLTDSIEEAIKHIEEKLKKISDNE